MTATKFWTACRVCGASTSATVAANWLRRRQNRWPELPYYNSFFQCATPPAIELAESLAQIAPSGFNRVFFTGSGSEANDTVIRMVRRYWELRGESKRTVIISRHNAYHGSTMAGASFGRHGGHARARRSAHTDIAHIRQPYWFGEGRTHTPDEFGLICARALADKIEEIGKEKVAAFIGEPVQGAGGVIVPPTTYWPEVQKICDHYGIPIIADEVICGFGRLGWWFGSEHFNIQAKIMPIAKGMTSGYLPMGGVLVHDDIAEVLAEKCGEFTTALLTAAIQPARRWRWKTYASCARKKL